MRHRVAEGDDFTDFVTGEIHKFCLAHQNLLMLFFYRYIFNDCIRQSPKTERKMTKIMAQKMKTKFVLKN